MVATVDAEIRRARIREVIDALKAQGKSQAEVASELDVTPQALTGWLKKGSIENQNAVKLAAMAGFPPTYLIFERAANAEEGDEDWSDILAFKQAAALGAGVVPDDYAETYKLKFRASSLARKRLRPDKLGVCYGRGDSMEPRIRNGDAILFDRGDLDPKDGALYVVNYNQHLMAKRLVKLGGRWFMDSLNKSVKQYEKPEPIDEHRGFEIVGRVRWVGSWED